MGYDLHKYERFHTFNVVPAGATSELAVAVNKAGHIVLANEVRAEAIPYCGLQGSLDAIKSAYADYPIGTLASVRNSDNLYQKTAEGVWTQIAIPAKGYFTPITANGQAVSDTNPAILRWHYQVPLTYLNADNNGLDSNRYSAKYLGVNGVSEAINQFVSATDNIYNNAVSSGYDIKVTKGGTAMNKGESEANDQWMDSPYSGMILFMKQQATGSDIRMTCFEYVGKTVQQLLNDIKVDTAGGIKGVTAGTGITVDDTTEGGLKPTVNVDTTKIATKQYVTESIEALDSTNNGGAGISVVQTNGIVKTTVTPANVDISGLVELSTKDYVVTAAGALKIADKSAADKIATELNTNGSIAKAIETAKNAAIAGSKVTIKTGTTTEEIQELTLTDTSTSSDDIKISITPQSNTASDNKLNLKVSASTTTLAKKADTISAEGKNTTVAAGTAPEIKVVLGNTISSPTLTVTATDVASASTLNALSKTVNDHIAAKGGALTLQLVDSLTAVTEPSTEVIYLVPAADSKDSNVKDEYIYVNGQFEKIGSTAVSLAGYATEDFVTGITDGKADKSTTYTKTEVDTALGGKADKSTTYTKTLVDTELGKKANSADVYTKTVADSTFAKAADTYTKTLVDTELGKKANSADVYTKTVADSTFAKASDTYTKTLVDTELGKKADKSTTYTKTEVDTELGKKADKSTTYTKTEVDTALSGKADKTNVVNSINWLKGDVDIKGEPGLSVAIGENNTISISETIIDFTDKLFAVIGEIASSADLIITNNRLNVLLDGSSLGNGGSIGFLNHNKINSITDSGEVATIDIIVKDVDLPICETLKNVTVNGKVSCPSLTVETSENIKLASVEAMLYLVDSLPTTPVLPLPGKTYFTMLYTAANENLELFNKLNAELEAKSWPEVTLLDDDGQSIN